MTQSSPLPSAHLSLCLILILYGGSGCYCLMEQNFCGNDENVWGLNTGDSSTSF